MKHIRARRFAPLSLIIGLLVLTSSLNRAEAQSGLPPLDSNCSDGECVFGVLTSPDDAGPKPECNNFDTTWHEIYLGRCYNGAAIVSGFRFANVTLPRGTGIAQAYLMFTVDGTSTTPITVAFYGENSSNAAAFSSASQPASRPRLSGLSTVWSVPSSDAWILNHIRQSPDITAIVQAIVDKSDWESGHALAILVEPTSATATGDYRRVLAYDRYGGSTAHSARLVIRTGPRKAYLPLIGRDFSSTTWFKAKAGMHLGNRGLDDWNVPADYLPRLRGTGQGAWPSTVVVLSNQVYNIQRSGTGCETITVNDVRSPYVFNYLNQAAQAGSKIVIRVYPSPGNFSDALQPQASNPSLHTLLISPGARPTSNSYCDIVNRVSVTGTVLATKRTDEFFRDVRDIAREMKAIHDYNATYAPAIAAQEFFMPANEPNLEWYAAWYNDLAYPNQQRSLAWSAMNDYFANVYDEAKSLNPQIRLLTPTMGQGLSAERLEFGTCNDNLLFLGNDNDPTPAAGYDFMEGAYRYKNEGIAWHNYWFKDKEIWDSNGCSDGVQSSHHVAQYFPTYLAEEIAVSGKPAFILEADLYSPCQLEGNAIQNKDADPNATANSLVTFIQEDLAATYVVAWLLTEKPHYTVPGSCVPPSEASEISWHEAYRETGVERSWFSVFWLHPSLP